jgi:hypothetical protein
VSHITLEVIGWAAALFFTVVFLFGVAEWVQSRHERRKRQAERRDLLTGYIDHLDAQREGHQADLRAALEQARARAQRAVNE